MPFYPYFLQPYIANVYGSRIYNSWETPNVSYEDFVTGVTKSYQDGGNFNKFYSDYVTRYFDERITGGTAGGVYVTGGTANSSNSTLVFTNTSGTSFTVTNSALLFNDAYVSGGTLNAATGIVTFSNTSGGTFTVSGFTGFTSYWSANTNESITTSGDSTNVHFPAIVGISGDTYIGGEAYVDIIKRESTNSNTTKLKSSANKWEIYAGHSSNEVMKIESGIVTVAGDITVDDFASLDSARIGVTATDPGTGHLYVEDNLTVDIETLYADKAAVTGVGGVGVGTLAPTHKLTVSGDSAITGWTEWTSTDFTLLRLTNGSERLDYNPTDTTLPSGAFGVGTSVRLYVEGTYYYTAVGGSGVSNGRFFMSDVWDQDTYETDSAAVASTIISYPSNINKSFAVYSGSDIAFQVSDKKVMSGSTDLLDIFASSGITNQNVYWSANTVGRISNSGLTTYIGIGTSNPNERLTVSGGISGDSTIAATTYNSTTSSAGYKLNGDKYLWLSSSDLQVGNVAADTDIIGISINLQTATTINSTLTVGVDDTGYDVKFFGATAGKYMLWDEDQDSLFFPDNTKIVLGTGSDTEIQQTGSETIIKDASTGNIKLRAGTVTIQNGAASKTMAVFNGANSVDLHYNSNKKFETTNTGIDVTGEVKGDTLDIDGNSQLDGTVTVGVDDTGYDVKFFGDTASAYMLWDTSDDDLVLGGAATLKGNRRFEISTTTDKNLAQGDIIYYGGGSTVDGDIVYMTTAGQWASASSNGAASATTMLGIALGTDPDVDGVLVRGTYTLDHDVGSNQGVPVYLSDTVAGQATVTAPSSSGDIVRIIGYNLGDAGEIWFDPDNTWVELS